MRKPAAAKEEKRAKETRDDPLEEAYKLLRPLANPAPSWSIINWNDQEISRSPKAEFYAAVGFVDAVFGAVFNDSAPDDFLVPFKDVALKQVLPALRRGRPPTRQKRGQHPEAFLLRDRWIAAVVDRICLQFELNPTRNETTEDKCGCSIVAEALKRLGFKRLGESHVENIWRRHRQ